MDNPWKKVSLDDYESHMSLSTVGQLQALDRIMEEQFTVYPIKSVAVLGVAGGNGLGHLIPLTYINEIYGIDINSIYLQTSARRYPKLSGRYHTLQTDINDDCSRLPHVDLVVANLFIEYVGYRNFAIAVDTISPRYVSCVIQIDPADSFVSESPFTHKLEILDDVHEAVNPEKLTAELGNIGYSDVARHSLTLPNGKILLRIDYEKQRQ